LVERVLVALDQSCEGIQALFFKTGDWVLKRLWFQHLQLEHHKVISTLAFNFNLRRYMMGPENPYPKSVGLEGPIIQSVSFEVTTVGGRAADSVYSVKRTTYSISYYP
jgi:hypothetical protein